MKEDDGSDDTQILEQYGDHQYTSELARCVVGGFIRDTQSEAQSLFVPEVIHHIVFAFYFQESSVYFHFSYRLHQFVGDKLMERIDGKSLKSSIQECVSELWPNGGSAEGSSNTVNATSAFCNLLRFGHIELTAIRASFFSLFEEPTAATTDMAPPTDHRAEANDQRFYVFSPQIMGHFQTFDKTQAMT